MKTTALAALIVSILNKVVSVLDNAAQEIETAISESGEENEGEETRSGKGSTGAKEKGAKGASKDDDRDGDDDDDGDRDTPSESDIIEAVRAALKVLEKTKVAKIIKKYGKADRASEVDEELRQKVIDELEKAIEAAGEAE